MWIKKQFKNSGGNQETYQEVIKELSPAKKQIRRNKQKKRIQLFNISTPPITTI